NGADYLSRLKTIDVYSWSYKSQDSTITHIGPMAQDFFTTFELGTDSTTINSGDFDGVNLLLLKALDEKMTLIEIQQNELIGLKNELILLQEQREKLYQMLLDLENKTAISKVD
ncbi:MAG: tail fiber domain-containing protein, partial [Crocinitomix sp.]|nr:tail fiber domain-containing protein [Crocinitomix sp.]